MNKLALAFIMALALLGACDKTVYHMGSTPTTPSNVNDGTWHTGMIYGLVELNETDIQAACPTGEAAEIREQVTFVNGFAATLLNGLVLGFPLVDFRSITVTCGSAQ